MKILIKFVGSFVVVVSCVAVLMLGSDLLVRQVEQSAVERYATTSQAVAKILRLEVALSEQVASLKDYALLGNKTVDLVRYRESRYNFLFDLSELDKLLPSYSDLAAVRRSHQTLMELESELVANLGSISPEESFASIRSHQETIGLYLDALADTVQEDYALVRQQANQSSETSQLIRRISLVLILAVFIGQLKLILLPVVRSIQELKLGAETIGAGDLNYRLNIHTKDEVEQLAHQFNLMAARLTESYHFLEQKVVERTQELEQEIVERRQAEADLNQILHELQQTQSQLIQTEKMSSLGQLVAGIAHEINNPVNFIYGNLTHANTYTHDLIELVQLYQQVYPNPPEVIQEQAETIDLEFLTEDLPKLLSSMRVGADRIRQIVLSLRNFSRIDEAEMKPVNLHDGLESTLLILQNRFKARAEHCSIEIVKAYGDLPLVECYAGQINQVFMNIINNAIDALETYQQTRPATEAVANPSRITIMTKQMSRDRVAIVISDNGPGMGESVRSRLFDPFFTTKPVGQGTGLGLSISYQIVVEKHGGLLYCRSTLDEGTEFWIELPIEPRPAVATSAKN